MFNGRTRGTSIIPEYQTTQIQRAGTQRIDSQYRESTLQRAWKMQGHPIRRQPSPLPAPVGEAKSLGLMETVIVVGTIGVVVIGSALFFSFKGFLGNR